MWEIPQLLTEWLKLEALVILVKEIPADLFVAVRTILWEIYTDSHCKEGELVMRKLVQADYNKTDPESCILEG